MSIQGVQGTPTLPPVASSSTASDGSAAAVRSTAAKPAADAEAAPTKADSDSKPATPRFPWLSRLSTQLAAASKTPTTFAAPIIGDNLDQRA